MVVIGIIVIFSVIGILVYQNYLCKVVFIDLLQIFVFYWIVIEFCVFDYGGLMLCDGGSNGIFLLIIMCYFFVMSVVKGVVIFIGQESLNGLGVILMLIWDNVEGVIGWQCVCIIIGNSVFQQVCEDVFWVK